MKSFAISITLGFLLYTRLVTAQTNLIFNGSFDTNTVGWDIVALGGGVGGNWSSAGYPGGCLALYTLNIGSATQYLYGLVPGSNYLFTWAGSGNFVTASVDDINMQVVGGSWEYFGFVFTAQSQAATHQMGFRNNGSVGTYYIDNVSIRSIPETPGPILQMFSTQNWVALSVSGPTGQSVVLEASTNLVSWQPFATNAMPFFHGHIPNNPITTFYRASKPF